MGRDVIFFFCPYMKWHISAKSWAQPIFGLKLRRKKKVLRPTISSLSGELNLIKKYTIKLCLNVVLS